MRQLFLLDVTHSFFLIFIFSQDCWTKSKKTIFVYICSIRLFAFGFEKLNTQQDQLYIINKHDTTQLWVIQTSITRYQHNYIRINLNSYNFSETHLHIIPILMQTLNLCSLFHTPNILLIMLHLFLDTLRVYVKSIDLLNNYPILALIGLIKNYFLQSPCTA